MPNVSASQLKRYAAALLGGGFLLAVLTPAYLIHALPGSAVYHRSPAIFVMQAIPYLLCATLWLPSRNPHAPKVALGLSILLFAVAGVLDLPQWVHPRSGGDMVGLGYILACLVLTTTIVVVSLVAVVVSWWSGRAN